MPAARRTASPSTSFRRRLPAGSEFQVNTSTADDQLLPKVASDAAGDFVIVWQGDYPNGKLDSVAFSPSAYASTGSALGSEFQVNTYTNGSQILPQIAMDSTGDFVIVWYGESADGSGYGIYAQQFNASGNPQGSEFRVNSNTAALLSAPTVAMDSAGDFVVGWTGAPYGNSETNIYAALQRGGRRKAARSISIATRSETNLPRRPWTRPVISSSLGSIRPFNRTCLRPSATTPPACGREASSASALPVP